MAVAATRPSARLIRVVYVAYFVFAGIGEVLSRQAPGSALAAAAQVWSTLWYGVVALVLCRTFGDPTRGAGALAMASALIGCLFQSLYYGLALDHSAYVVAFGFFGLFLFFLGILVVRSALVPRAIGYALMLGVAAPLLSFAPPAIAPAFVLIAAAEGVLFLWLLIFGIRRS